MMAGEEEAIQWGVLFVGILIGFGLRSILHIFQSDDYYISG